MLNLLDSPLNKAGLLQVYIHTDSNVLIEVSPHLRIPRTYKRFAGLMVQLLHKMKIRSSDGKKTLLRVIKNPITAHLPPGAPIIGNVAALLSLVQGLGGFSQNTCTRSYINERETHSADRLSGCSSAGQTPGVCGRSHGKGLH